MYGCVSRYTGALEQTVGSVITVSGARPCLEALSPAVWSWFNTLAAHPAFAAGATTAKASGATACQLCAADGQALVLDQQSKAPPKVGGTRIYCPPRHGHAFNTLDSLVTWNLMTRRVISAGHYHKNPTSEKFCITTAINYANGNPHMGHAYESISTDVIARYHRAYGRQVRLRRYRSPRHRMSFHSTDESSECVSMTWRASAGQILLVLATS